jgi:hypothetical protein
MQLVSVQWLTRQVGLIKLVPPGGYVARKSRLQAIANDSQRDHQNNPGPKIDLNVGSRD